ncbi:MAG: DM13 domain-containing protein [Anaerolineaceae bacterium]|nr:DM13 domain-containing protein [Anaerolineaceae bacterium]MCY4022489.1 DM13 domain-containing protein [Anaerolineaceae bacterium]
MDRRRLVISALVLVAVVLVLVTRPWTFFINDEVDEAFPMLSSAERESVRDMPDERLEVLLEMAGAGEDGVAMAADTARAMMEPDKDMQDDMPDSAPEPHPLLSGTWIEIDPVHRAEGSATVWLAGEERVLRFEDFRVTNGPQLHVLLTKNVPTSIFAGVGASGEYIDLGPLKGNVGNQNYNIPAEVNLSEYRSAVIYCVPFNVVFSSAELTDPGG